jgi:hypothetical protein
MSNDVYFAKAEVDKLIDKCEAKINRWGATGSSAGFFTSAIRAIYRNTYAYYAAMLEPQAWDSGIIFEGEKGELAKTIIPKARVLIRQYISLATKQRYSFDCVTDVGDSNPMMTARIGNSIVKSETDKHKIDLLAEKIVETCSVEGWCYCTNTWNTGSGEIWARADDQGNMLYSGGTDIELFTIQDVIFDWTKKNPQDLEWIIIRKKKNRWDLISQFPEMADAIRALPIASFEQNTMPTTMQEQSEYNEDDVFIREFYHKPTPALPFGRMAIWGNKDTVFFDKEENPYGCLPGVMFVFQPVKNTLIGYPMMSNLLVQQELFAAEMGTVATNHSAFGVQSVLCPRGSNISVNQIAAGMTFLDYTPANAEGGGEIKSLNLTNTPPEIFNFIQMLSSGLEEMSNINSTLRGQPPANVTSGAMAATLSANALEFIYSDTKGLTMGLETLLSMSIKNYQKFAKVDQVIDVIGEGNSSMAQDFKSEDITGIKQIKIRQGNPLLNTIAGRLQLGESILPLLQAGKNDAVTRYLGILEGAPVESLFESELSEGTAVSQEIEALQRGEQIAPLISDNHPMFIRAYQKLVYSPAVRKNGTLVQSLLALMMERLNLEMQCPPELKAILRNLPMPMMAPEAPVPPTDEAPSESAAQEPVTQPSQQALPAQAQV